jgi:hypothetical protein
MSTNIAGLSPRVLLNQRLGMVGANRMMIGSMSALTRGLIAMTITIVAWIWADVVLELFPRMRVAGWICAGIVLLIVALREWLRHRREASSEKVASDIDALAGSNGQVRAALDLARGQHSGSVSARSAFSTVSNTANFAGGGTNSSTVTAGMIEIAIRRAAAIAAELPSRLAAPTRPFLVSCGLAAGVFVVLLVLGLSMPRLFLTELKRFFNPYGGHPAWSQYEFDVQPGDARVRFGDSLEITATVTGPPFEQLELVLVSPVAERIASGGARDVAEAQPIDVLPMFPDSAGSWRASLANITSPFEYYLRVRRARSRESSVMVLTIPEIIDVRAEVSAPLYTGLATIRGPMPSDGVEGLPGTIVRVTATSNRPLAGGLLKVSRGDVGEELPLFPDGEHNSVSGEFTMTSAGRIEVSVVDEVGQQSANSASWPIRLLIDQAPLVRLTQPRAVSFATPTAVIPVVIAAEDDYGLRRCQLFRGLNGSRHLPLELPLEEGSPRRAQMQTLLPLEAYQLQPGDEISLFARVEDNDPAGPDAPIGKGTESSIVSIRIISEEEFSRARQQQAGIEMLMSRHQQAQRRLESLAARMEELQEKLQSADPNSAVAKELSEELGKLSEELLEAADALEAIANKPLPLDLDKQLAPKLKEMSELLKQLAQEARLQAGNEALTENELREKLKQNIAALRQQREQHEKDAIQPLERLAQVMPLKQDESLFVQLVMKQRDLADRMKSLKNADQNSEPAIRARMRDLEEEQRKVSEQLRELLDKIDEDIARLPDDPELDDLRNTARAFVDAVRSSGADGMMADAESGLARFDGATAAAKSDEAATTLEKFLSQCKGMGDGAGSACMSFSPGMGESLANTLQQLVPGMGGKSGGIGLGQSGSGGYSSQSSTLDNVGLYGTDPVMDASSTSSGGSDSQSAATASELTGTTKGRSESGFSAQQPSAVIGGSDSSVPPKYRRQTGIYLQRLAEELEP